MTRTNGSFRTHEGGCRNADGFGPVQDHADALGIGRATRIQVGVGVDQAGQWFRGGRLLSFGAHSDTLK